MSNLNSKPFIVDRPGSGVRTTLVYDASRCTDPFVTASLDQSMNTSATQRIGLPSVKSLVPSRSFEATGVGGVKIGVATLFNVEEAINEGNDTRNLDRFRTGRNIKTYKHFSSNVVRPMIRISPESFFEEESKDRINHVAGFNSYGFGMFFKIFDENYKLIPVQDFSELIPTDLVGKKLTSAYPFVFNNKINYAQFVDPSHPNNAGAIDVFEVRRAIANLSVSDIELFGLKVNLSAGGIVEHKKGSTLIVDKIDINQNRITTLSLYDDAQETEFKSGIFVTRNKEGEENHNKAFPMPGYIDPGQYKLSPFVENVDYIRGSYDFAKDDTNMVNFLSSSRNRMSEIGSRFKSSTCGLIFGESNSLGTDSIAFGGLKK